MSSKTVIAALVIAVSLLSACGGAAGPSSGDEAGRLKVVATTTIVADVVSQVGGEFITLNTLLPVGVDPHAFEPRPQDLAAVAEADLIFAAGLGLEPFLEPLMASAASRARLVEVSAGIELLPFEGDEDEDLPGDPHTWSDPNNVILWSENIAGALAEADAAHAETYAANAEAYVATLRELDAWIRVEAAQIPPERRRLVSDHAVFGYFAEEYGFEQVGTVVGSFSTVASPSARELAALEDAIRAYGVPAIFVGTTVNPALAEQVARDTGIKVVPLYTDSLTPPGGEAESYLEFMRYNVRAMVEALKYPSLTPVPSP